jgi:hypothetical protein
MTTYQYKSSTAGANSDGIVDYDDLIEGPGADLGGSALYHMSGYLTVGTAADIEDYGSWSTTFPSFWPNFGWQSFPFSGSYVEPAQENGDRLMHLYFRAYPGWAGVINLWRSIS